MSFGINRISTGIAQFLFWTFAVLMGASLSTIFLAYTDASIALTFFATAAAFASLSLYGYTTKRDLSGMGTFLLMGLVGLIVASIVNLFCRASTMQPGDRGDRRARLRGPHRLRHAEDQEHLFRDRRAPTCSARPRSWAR